MQNTWDLSDDFVSIENTHKLCDSYFRFARGMIFFPYRAMHMLKVSLFETR